MLLTKRDVPNVVSPPGISSFQFSRWILVTEQDLWCSCASTTALFEFLGSQITSRTVPIVTPVDNNNTILLGNNAFPHLHENLADNHIIIVPKHCAEDNSDSVLFGLNIPAGPYCSFSLSG